MANFTDEDVVARTVETARQWESGEWRDQVSKRGWVRHFADLGLTLEQFTGSVLDVGCGATGTIFYLPNATHRVGVDPAAYGAERWNVDDPALGRHKVELHNVPAERLTWPDNHFDAVFSINCLDHTSDPTACLREIHRVVKPGGRIVLHFDIDSPLRKLHKAVRPTCALLHPHSFSYDWVEREVFSRFNIERTYRDPETFKGRRAKLYEAYWDDLLYRMTGSNTFINHLWMTGTK